MFQVRKYAFTIFLLAVGFISMAQPLPVIHQIAIVSPTPRVYHPVSIELDITATFRNPFDYQEIHIQGECWGPDSSHVLLDGFFVENFVLRRDGSLAPQANGFEIRFTPQQAGLWTIIISVTDQVGTSHSEHLSFEVLDDEADQALRFATIGSDRQLRDSDGTPLVLIGMNLAWTTGSLVSDYTRWLDSLSANGGNFFRIWQAHWGLGLEWKKGNDGFEGLLKYEQKRAAYTDWLISYAFQKRLYMMLCLQHHGTVSTRINPDWQNSPYNSANGGPCHQPIDFFTDQEARRLTKNRFRYVVARWGHSPAVLAWELFNEVDWLDNYDQHQTEVMEWHADMAAFLKEIDPYHHLRTTSFAHEKNDPTVWANPDFDFTQTHHYLASPNPETVIAQSQREYRDIYDKPTLTGEFGIGEDQNLGKVDPDGVHIHNGMWASLLSGGLGTGMSWWWDSYLDPMNLYFHFGALREMSNRLAQYGRWAPVEVSVTGQKGTLRLIASTDWAMDRDTQIDIASTGQVSPARPNLGIYLYGHTANAEFRDPPTFQVYYPEAGAFTVRTGSSKSTLPRIRIQVDGKVNMNRWARESKTYSVQIPAGAHTIEVDNPGQDWISISSYEFEGMGDPLDAFVMASQDSAALSGWLLNPQFNHANLAREDPDLISETILEVEGLRDNTYFLKWIDCLSGTPKQVDQVAVNDGKLSVAIPPIVWDMAFFLDEVEEEAEETSALALAFQTYPNPVKAGDQVTIILPELSPPMATAHLIDIQGKTLMTSPLRRKKEYEIQIPPQIPAGYYWLRLSAGNMVGTSPLVITED